MVGFLLQDDAQNAQQSVLDDFRRRADELMAGAQQQVTSLFQPPAPPPVQQPQAQPQATSQIDQFRQQASSLMPDMTSLFQQPPPVPQPQTSAPAAVNHEVERFRQMADAGMGPSAPPSIPAQPAAMPQAPALEPAHEPSGPTTVTPVNDRWSTSFDFGQTYTGAYRTGTPHRGIDLIPRGGGGIGTEVDAFTPGTVTNISRDSGAGGLMVYVQDDGGLTHAYMHLADTAPGLAVGQRVNRGTPIASMGESGTEGSPHLHYEVRKNAASGDPLNQLIDPRPYMAGNQAGTGVQSTAGLSGGGAQAGQVGQRGQDILSGAADIASWLGDQGQKALQAILITEGGLNNARGDNGQSAGPLQFFEGGQLANFARATGQTLQDAKTYVERHPLEAIRWAIGTPTNPGYLGLAILNGISQNMMNADLATFAQRTGQVSVSPERAGDNWQALFGGGQALINAGVDVGRQLAQGGENLVRSGTDLVSQTGDTLRNQFANLQGGASSRGQDLLRQLEEGSAQRQRDFEQTMAGFRAPSIQGLNVDEILDAGRNLPGVSDFLRGYAAGQQAGGFTPEFSSRAAQVANAPMEAQGIGGLLGTGGNIVPPLTIPEWQNLNERRREAIRAVNPVRDQPFVGGAAELAGDILTDPTTYMLGGPLARLGGRVGGALSTNVPRALTTATRLAGDQATQGAMYSALQAASRPGATPQDIAAAAAEGAVFGGATGVGMAGIGAGARAVQPYLGARQRAEAEIGFAMGMPSAREPVSSESTRMFHGTGAAFESVDPTRLHTSENLFGPGYYMTTEPRVAGGRVAAGGEPIPNAPRIFSSASQRGPNGELLPINPQARPPGQVIEPGYAQSAARPPEEMDLLTGNADMARRILRETELTPSGRQYMQEQLAQQEAAIREFAGPNVRALDVPRELRLLNADRYVEPQDLAVIRNLVPDDQLRMFDMMTSHPRAFEGRPTGEQVWDALVRAAGGRSQAAMSDANRLLAEAGFDGITYAGGRRIPMTDEAGRALEHQATVVFPESVDKVRNAISGRQGGQASLPFAANLGAGAIGGATGYLTAPEDATEQEKLTRAGVGAGIGLAGGAGLTRALDISPLTRGQIGQVENLLRSTIPQQLPFNVAQKPLTRGENVAQWISSNLLSGPGLIWNSLTQGMHLGWQPILRAAEGHPVEAFRGFQAMLAGIPDALDAGGRVIMRGEPYPGVSGQPGRTIGKWFPGLRANLAGDAVLRTLNERMAGMLEAQRLIREAGATTPQQAAQVIQQHAADIARVAEREGNVSALTGAGGRSPWIKSLTDTKTSLLQDANPAKQALGVLMHVAMPFARVPEEVLYQVGRNMPVLGNLIDALQFVKAAPGDSRRTAGAKAGLNGAMTAAIIGGTLTGLIRGPDDLEHPNAVNLGGNWVPLGSLGTLGGRMGIVASMFDGWRKGENSTEFSARITNAVNNLGKFAEQEYPLDQSIRILSRVGRGQLLEAGGELLGGAAQGMVPLSGALGAVENIVDPNVRESTRGGLAGLYEPMLARIPGAANLIPERIDPLTGRPQPKPSSGPGSLLRVQNANRPLLEEFANLNRAGFRDIKLPDSALPTTRTVMGVEVPISKAQGQQIQAARGQVLANYARVLENPNYAKMTDLQRAFFWQQALTEANRVGNITGEAVAMQTPNLAEEVRTRRRVAGRLVQAQRQRELELAGA